LEKPQPIQPLSQPLPVSLLLVTAVAVHLPLLVLELPLKSANANFHIFFASHYLHHWFNPWNSRWYAGFSQTTYPPLSQQWVAVIARAIGLDLGYMAVQLAAILLLVVGVYRFARLWVGPRAASMAALASIFLGSESYLVYSEGQLAATLAAPLLLNALPFLYEWVRRGSWRSFLKATALLVTAAAAHDATLFFGTFFFVLPVLALAYSDSEGGRVSAGAFCARTIAIAVFASALIGVVLFPLWIALLHSSAAQSPVLQPSRANYILNAKSGFHYFVVPYGAMILALPFIFFLGAGIARLRPLLFGFWVAFLIGLGGTTPVGHALLGSAFEQLSIVRFSYWATLLALPFVGVLAEELIDRFAGLAVVGLAILALFSCGLAVEWAVYRPTSTPNLEIATVAEWLNRGHDQYRYFTLGFGNNISRLAMLTDAGSVDGDWNFGRSLPELTRYGGGPLTDAKQYGEPGLDALRAMLADADRYGVRWVFVSDHSYDPLLYFAGWRQADSLEDNTIAVWTKDDVTPATPLNNPQVPPQWQGLMWGIFPCGSSIIAMLVLLIPEKKRSASLVEPVLARDENPIFGRLVS
jgi:hypothetical protein